MTAQAFRIDVNPAEVEDLMRRIDATRLPSAAPCVPWGQGVDLAWLRELLARWREFDWPAAQAELNALPHFTQEIDGEQTHYLHFRSGRSDAIPVLLAHGWPGSFVEYLRVASALVAPASAGQPDRLPCDVVVPSLPGFAFSQAPTVEGVAPGAIAQRWLQLMNNLGYHRFVAQGGDLGASVCVCIARQAPRRLLGLHLNYVPGTYLPEDRQNLTDAESAFLAHKQQWSETEGAYGHLHSTKPQTLAYALTDSPAALAAWIGEKFHAWTATGVNLHRQSPLTKALLTNLCIYWFTRSAASSLRLYWETKRAPVHLLPGEMVAPPLGVACFPGELPMPPRSWVERGFSDVRRWTLMPSGGHFAALEEPESFADELHAFIDLAKPCPDEALTESLSGPKAGHALS